MATDTTNYLLKKPTVGGDDDLWGGYINDNMDTIDTQMKSNDDAAAAAQSTADTANTTANAALPKAGGTMTGDIAHGDNVKAKFGTSDDLQIYHDGSNSYVQDLGSGSLYLKTNGSNVNITSDAGNMALFARNGAVNLYHNNSNKFATTSTGVDVTGTVTADGLTIGSSGNITGDAVMRIRSTEGNRGSVQISAPHEGTNREVSYGNNLYLTGADTYAQDTTALGGAAIVMSASNANYGWFKFKAKQDPDAGGALADRLYIDANGDISFYEDTGTTAKFFWDASAERLGIGTTSPSAPIDVVGASGSVAARVGNSTGGTDFEITVTENDGTLLNSAEGAAARHMKFATGGTERARIDSSGNVGIGTTSPNDTLDIRGGNIVNPNNTGSEITSATIGLGSNIHLEERQPNGAYSDRTDLVWKTNQGYGLGERDQMRLDSGGNLTLAGGVYLGGTGAANKLDDYESGTFTVTTAGDASGVIGTETGEYTKIGNLVTVRIVFSVTTTFTSNNIGGLPFTPNLDSSTSSVGGAVPVFTESSGVDTFARWQNGSTSVKFYTTTSNNTHVPSATRNVYRFTFSYYTDA